MNKYIYKCACDIPKTAGEVKDYKRKLIWCKLNKKKSLAQKIIFSWDSPRQITRQSLNTKRAAATEWQLWQPLGGQLCLVIERAKNTSRDLGHIGVFIIIIIIMEILKKFDILSF